MKKAYYFSSNELEDGDEVIITFDQDVTFLNKAAIKSTFANVKPKSSVILDASHSHYIDMDVIELIEEFTNYRAKEDKIDVKLIGFETITSTPDINEHSNIKVVHRTKE